MRVLIACEYSGKVRDAFAKKGHFAMSCDLLPSDNPKHGVHYIGDVLDLLSDYNVWNRTNGWDLMIAFPPCTHLAVSGARWFPEKRADGRQQQGIDFFMALANAEIPKIAIENPVGIMSTKWRKPNQIIQPYEFGHDASKKTCLWLKNLPELIPTDIIKKDRYANQTPSGQNKLGPSADRWKLRSETYQGIAEAMAAQWN